jgi:hypothetical protein
VCDLSDRRLSGVEGASNERGNDWLHPRRDLGPAALKEIAHRVRAELRPRLLQAKTPLETGSVL